MQNKKRFCFIKNLVQTFSSIANSCWLCVKHCIRKVKSWFGCGMLLWLNFFLCIKSAFHILDQVFLFIHWVLFLSNIVIEFCHFLIELCFLLLKFSNLLIVLLLIHRVVNYVLYWKSFVIYWYGFVINIFGRFICNMKFYCCEK